MEENVVPTEVAEVEETVVEEKEPIEEVVETVEEVPAPRKQTAQERIDEITKARREAEGKRNTGSRLRLIKKKNRNLNQSMNQKYRSYKGRQSISLIPLNSMKMPFCHGTKNERSLKPQSEGSVTNRRRTLEDSIPPPTMFGKSILILMRWLKHLFSVQR
jgi:hypothetical protein